MKKFRFTRSALLVLPALVLAACGGGGGGGDGGSNNSGSSTPTYSPTLAISTSNAKPVAADGLDATTNTGGVQGGASIVTGVLVDAGGSSVTVPTLSAVALKLAGLAAGKVPTVVTGVAVDERAACTYGGSISIQGSVAGGDALVAGDTLTITASNCTEVIDGQTSPSTLNGSLTITVNAGSFNSAGGYPQKITMTFVARNLSTTTLGVTNVSDGDMKIDLNQVTATAGNSTVSGASLSNSYTRSGVTRSVALKNYSFAQTVSGTQVSSNVTATVVSTNSRVGSNVVYTVTTPSPIVKDLGVIASGSLKVTGASSGLLLTVTSPNNFTLQVDANGDGTYESSSTTTLAELQGLL